MNKQEKEIQLEREIKVILLESDNEKFMLHTNLMMFYSEIAIILTLILIFISIIKLIYFFKSNILNLIILIILSIILISTIKKNPKTISYIVNRFSKFISPLKIIYKYAKISKKYKINRSARRYMLLRRYKELKVISKIKEDSKFLKYDFKIGADLNEEFENIKDKILSGT
jgi:hypothetical protein